MFARQILESRGRPTAGLSSLACVGFSLIFLITVFTYAGVDCLERIYFSSLYGSGGCRLCMICFGFSGAVVSVGMIIGIFVVAGIIIGYHFWVVRCGVKKGRNKNYNPLTISE